MNMSLGILGTKVGMTQIFDNTGQAVPVTVIKAEPCLITQFKTLKTDGYNAVQLGYQTVAEKKLTKPELGHLQKTNSEPVKYLKEFRLSIEEAEDFQNEYQLSTLENLKEKKTIGLNILNSVQTIDVTGYSIGRGFMGYQKRHNFKRGPMSHGSKNHRLPGSIGAGSTPGRVYPGTRMAGRKISRKTTIKKLQIVQIDLENSLLIIKGSVPGKAKGLLYISPSKTR
uniref:Large ribosomal subunit protein uL3c n=1 Tax=Glaucocystis sp. BBH TaxID=2023628 RepID=A0A3G1IUX7_9EUKA|nr:ribosomal protein L13 [Glaucocystis sp. BBH]